jgi:hypothetical protein
VRDLSSFWNLVAQFVTASRNAGFKGPVEDLTVKNVCLTRLGQPQDIANMALFLASDESSFITSQDYKVDGVRFSVSSALRLSHSRLGLHFARPSNFRTPGLLGS